jgi:hypothetical protein
MKIELIKDEKQPTSFTPDTVIGTLWENIRGAYKGNVYFVTKDDRYNFGDPRLFAMRGFDGEVWSSELTFSKLMQRLENEQQFRQVKNPLIRVIENGGDEK